jgi:hypothetical protein
MGGEFRLDPCGGVGLGEVDRQHQRPRTSCRGDFVCHEAAQLDHAEQLSMIDVNIRFLTELSLAFVDTLSRRRGGIMSPGFWSPVQGPSHLAAIVILILPPLYGLAIRRQRRHCRSCR